MTEGSEFFILWKGTRKIQKGHSQNQENSREKNGETSQLRLAPLRSARRPLFLNALSKITLKRGNPRFFLIDFWFFSQKWQTKKTPNTRRCWGLTIIYLCLSFLSSCCALHHSNISALICQYSTTNCNFYKCTFKLWFEIEVLSQPNRSIITDNVQVLL